MLSFLNFLFSTSPSPTYPPHSQVFSSPNSHVWSWRKPPALRSGYVFAMPLGLGPRETLLEGPLAAHQPTPANPLAAPVTVACRGMPRAALPALGTFLGHSGRPQRPIFTASSLGSYSRIWVFKLPATPRIVPRVLFLQETVLLHSRGLWETVWVGVGGIWDQ